MRSSSSLRFLFCLHAVVDLVISTTLTLHLHSMNGATASPCGR